MNDKLSHVFRTYDRRPIVRLFAACALLIGIGLFVQGFFHGTTASIAPEIQLTGNSARITIREWDEHLWDRDPAELDSLMLTDLASLNALPQEESEHPNLTPLVNLTTLKLDSSDFTLQKLEEVQSLKNLRALALQAPSIPQGTWAVLGPKLRRLQIPLRLLLSHPDEVSQLVELRMLRVNRTGITPQALSVIAQIPNLEHLVLSYGLVDHYAEIGPPQPTRPPMPLTPETLRPLAGHPSLEAIFAYWPHYTPRTIPALPGVQLYPAGYPQLWESAFLFGLFFTAAIAAIVAVQVWAHFVIQTAAVVPGYAGPHQLAAILVLLGGSLASAIGLWLSEIALLPGLVISLVPPTALLGMVTTSQSRSQTVRTLGVILIYLVFWLPLAIGIRLPPVMAGEFVWFLRGEFAVITLLILLGECALLGLVFRQLPKLVYRVYERSSLPPGLSPWDPRQQRRTTYSSKNWWLGLRNRDEQYDQLKGASNWQRVRLWQAGNIYRLRDFIIYGGMFVVFFMVMQLVIHRDVGLFNPSLWRGCMVQLGAMILIFPPLAWHQRCRSLKVESLRPVRRKDLVRQLFTALALDQSLALVPLVIAFALLVAFPRAGGSEAEPFIVLALGLAGLSWVYALSTTVFAVKRAWVFVGFIVAMIVLPIAIITGFAGFEFIIDEPRRPAEQVVLVSIISLAILALAAGILGGSYWRSLRREWG